MHNGEPGVPGDSKVFDFPKQTNTCFYSLTNTNSQQILLYIYIYFFFFALNFCFFKEKNGR